MSECPFCGANVRRRSRIRAFRHRIQMRMKGLTPDKLEHTEDEQKTSGWGSGRRLRLRSSSRDDSLLLADDDAESSGLRRRLRVPDLGLGTPYAVGFLILANIFAFFAFTLPSNTDPGVLSAVAVKDGGEWWRLLTYQFMHSGVLEMIFSVLLLALFAVLVEGRYGHIGTIAIYLGAGIVGGIVAILADPAVVTAGSLVSTIGLMGAWLVMSARPREPNEAYPLPAGLILVGVLLLYGGFLREVSFWGELGGLAFGAGLAAVLELIPSREQET